MKTCPNCKELLGDSVAVCFNCRYDFARHKVLSNEERKQNLATAEQNEQYKEQQKTAALQKTWNDILAVNDLYEYAVVAAKDSKTGGVSPSWLNMVLQEHAEQGWRLVSTFTNELGHNQSALGMGGITLGTNSTIDETVLIFERCVKRYPRTITEKPEEK